MRNIPGILLLACAITLLVFTQCSKSKDPTVDRVGIGGQCVDSTNCLTDSLTCLLQFKGGYCGLAGCDSSVNCPSGGLCVKHTDGTNYCFRACLDKPECNRNRNTLFEANCSSSFSLAHTSETYSGKACIPPSN